MIDYDLARGEFKLSDGQASDAELCTRLNRVLMEIRGWLDVKRQNGRFASGFLMELVVRLRQIDPADLRLPAGFWPSGADSSVSTLPLALGSEVPHFHLHAVFDEIGKLEGTDPIPSMTKKPRQMRHALRGLWHKHYFQPSFIPHNLLNELDRMEQDGRWEALWAPHYGKFVDEIAGQVVHEMTISAFERRSQDRMITGEFIVFEKRTDGSNYYLTLGKHGEWDAIRTRVDHYKRLDSCDG